MPIIPCPACARGISHDARACWACGWEYVDEDEMARKAALVRKVGGAITAVGLVMLPATAMTTESTGPFWTKALSTCSDMAEIIVSVPYSGWTEPMENALAGGIGPVSLLELGIAGIVLVLGLVPLLAPRAAIRARTFLLRHP